VDDWNLDPDPVQSETILRRCAEVEPRLAVPQVLGYRVGPRPGRPSVRLDVDEIDGARHLLGPQAKNLTGIDAGALLPALDPCPLGRMIRVRRPRRQGQAASLSSTGRLDNVPPPTDGSAMGAGKRLGRR